MSEKIKKTDRTINTTAKVGDKAYGFRLFNGSEMSARFPDGVYIVVDPEMVPVHESFVLAIHEGAAMFRQLIVQGGKRFLKAMDARYPLLPMGKKDLILAVAIETNMRL